ncbi:MAG: HAD family hydrolase [Acidimicrobiales bacterium]|nr:HAD family hydrolase [Acidimicrobiales bacterium]
MWSGPRTVSTALMRAWENRSDTAVMDEPLYAYYLFETGAEHPGSDDVIRAGPTGIDDAVGLCVQPRLESGQSISYQKHMAHHLLENTPRQWIEGATNLLLIRDPRRVIVSYAKVLPRPTLRDLGFPQLVDLQRRFGPLPVIDSDALLTGPERALRTICGLAGVGFDPAMLSWPAGSRPSDGVWAAHWYSAVEASTSFAPPPVNNPAILDVPDGLDSLVEAASEYYHELLCDRVV